MARAGKKVGVAGGLRAVAAPEDFGIKVVWADPASVSPNEMNWRVHPDDQKEVVRDLIDRHGWLKPFLYNERSGKLVDGHARLEVAVAKGVPAIPVWVGSWDEAGEAEILALLDESARMAEAEPDKLKLLLSRMTSGTTKSLGALLSRLKNETGLDETLSRMHATPPAAALAAGQAPTGGVPDPASYRPLAAPPQATEVPSAMVVELHTHPKDFVTYSPEQITNLAEGVKANGLYQAVTVADDGTILAARWVVPAARLLGLDRVPVSRIDAGPDDVRCLKILAGDNERGRMADVDDRKLTDLLKEIKGQSPDGLSGTGYDDMMLANLVMVTRPQSEIADFNAAAHWVGMPEYEEGATTSKIIISFRDDADLETFAASAGLDTAARVAGKTFSTWWPPKERQDLASVRFEG